MRIIPFFTTESQLVKALQRGEGRAQKVVYEKYAARMLAVCARYVINLADAEEVMIDGFMRVFEKIQQFREDGSLEGWIRRIMVTESLMYLRRTKAWRQEVSIDDSTEEPDYQWADETLNADELLRLVNQLPNGYRMVFNLYAIEGYNHAEIAEMLGVTESTSKSQLHRARALLQQNLKKIEDQIRVNNSQYAKTSHR